ncbi:MAG: amino acid adenylation domain-containing protein [Candidatus Omnitrophota bacterium]
MSDHKIDKQNVDDMMSLTSMQEGMFFHYLSNPSSAQYREQFRFKLRGEMNAEWFKQAWHAVSQTNEILRAVMRWEKLDEPVLIVLKDKELPIRVWDLRAEADKVNRLGTIIRDDRQEPLDLAVAPIRITLVILGNRESEMILTFHHLLVDGWSSAILLGEFLELYNRLSRGDEPLKITKTGYKEFIKWYRINREKNKEATETYWTRKLDGFDTRTLLPYDKTKVEAISRVQTLRLKTAEMITVEENLRPMNAPYSLPCILYAAWGILLQIYNDFDDIIFGTTVSGRSPEIKDVDTIVGLFINTIPLRVKSSGDQTFLNVLETVNRDLEERRDYDHTPLPLIKQWSRMGNETDLFDSLVVIDNYPLPVSNSNHALQIESFQTIEMTNFDLTVQTMASGSEPGMLTIDFHYNPDVFEPATIERMSGHYLNIISAMGRDPHQTLSGFGMLSEEEREQIIYEFNSPDIEYRVDKTIHGVIEDRAMRVPDNIAVRFEDRSVTYGAFDDAANRLAVMLRQYGVTETSRVALFFPRSVELIVSLIGILKTGAACIPLDMLHPRERNQFIVEDSGARFLLTVPDTPFETPPNVTTIIFDPKKLVDNDRNNRNENARVSVQPQDLSFMIYTSGSTGKPKGALLHHSGIVNHATTKIDVLNIQESDIVGNNFSLNFIASIWQVLSPLFMGAQLIVYSNAVEWDPYLQFQKVVTDRVTVIEVIPSILKSYLFLVDEGKEAINLNGVRKIALTGEETKPFLVDQFYRLYTRIDLVNCYGQTECSDDVLHHRIPFNTRTEKVLLGKPSLNTQVLIMNHHLQMQPVGAPGEICVKGAGVCDGYWNRPELNDEKFLETKKFLEVQKPFFKKVFGPRREVLYRTGDLGRWTPDGNVEYLGRLDHQVKIRGNRVELREIENRIIAYEGIKEAAVVVKDDPDGERNLHAFFTASQTISPQDIRQYLVKRLPDYMIPTDMVQLEQFPLTPSGKIDRKSLVHIKTANTVESGMESRPPRNDFEHKIQNIWKQLLNKDIIGTDDNFFDRGGHSLLLIKLKNKLEKTFQLKRELPIVELFNYPTIGSQARWVEEHTIQGIDGKPTDNKDIEKHTGQKLTTGNRDVAVIGISCRVPGASHIDELWKHIIDGVESISFFSPEELEVSESYNIVRGHSTLVPAGGVIGDIDMFDADFFGYHPREAELMDPQQRLFLEHAWMALEDAGYVGETYPGSIGVYAGVSWNTYLLNNVLKNPGVLKALGEFQTMIGNDKDFLATRVSYKLNLRGPSVTLQTACSTSLTALHFARQGLLNRECDMALTGGVVVRVPEKTGYFYTEGGHLSPDGHCRPFDAEAKGTVFGNGVAVVVLKRLENAVNDNDHIYAVIKGSAINNDGALKVGYTSPGETGQYDVIKKALHDANIHPGTIGYVETHGTGTVLGDPVEISALTRAYRDQEKEKKQYCAIGSIKANIGHLDVAAGIIGFIKAVLCLKHQQIPPSIHITQPNPLLNLTNSPFYVNTTLRNWPTNESPRRASVSALGIGGTNAHVILEEYMQGALFEKTAPCTPAKTFDWGYLLLFSARTESVLDWMRGNLLECFKKNPIIDLTDTAYTLQIGRARFPYRQMMVCTTIEDAIDKLEQIKTNEPFFHASGNRPVIFMFSGQGAQYVNMGRELYQTIPVLREEMDRCFNIFKSAMGYELKEVLFTNGETGETNKNINGTEFAQPLLFIFEYALSKLLMKWGIKPYAMIGHSIGEYTAACLSGVLSLEDAITLVATRGKLMQTMPPGAMLGVPLSESDLIPLLNAHNQREADDKRLLSLAAVNSSPLCVISGVHESISQFEAELKRNGHDCSLLHTSHAFHSSMMDPILNEFEHTVSNVRLNHPSIPYISNVSGDWITAADVLSPAYWSGHLRHTVRFADGITKLLEIESPVFIEIGPGNVLSTFVKRHAKADKRDDLAVIDLIRHPQKQISDHYYLLDRIGQLWLCGIDIDWTEYYHEYEEETGCRPRRIPLPVYPFDRKKYWLQPGKPTEEINKDIKDVKQTIDKWFYIPSWKQSVRPFMTGSKPETDILFIQTETAYECIDRLIERFNSIGRHTITVQFGNQFQRVNDINYTIRPACPEDDDALMTSIAGDNRTIGTIVHAGLLDTVNESDIDDIGDINDIKNDIDHHLEHGMYSLLYLVQAIGKQSMFHDIELFILSTGMHRIERGDSQVPGKSTVIGPCKVISQEYPHIICRSVDIDLCDNPENVAQNLLTELTACSPDRVIAYRGNQRWVQYFEPLPSISIEPVQLKPHGVYLITGGLGKIGLTFAQYLAEAVQAKLVLTSRSAISTDADCIRQLEQAGAEVMVIQADVSDREQMERAVRLTEERFGRVHGVFHNAGVMDIRYFKSMNQMDRETCEVHFKPKVHGIRVLESVFRDRQPAFYMLTSSLSSVLGGMGMVAYSAANSFLDAFAQEQTRRTGVSWLAVNWDEWESEKPVSHQVPTMTRDEGKDVFKRMLYVVTADHLKHIPGVIVSCRDLGTRWRQWVEVSSRDRTASESDVQTHAKDVPPGAHKRTRKAGNVELPRSEAEKIIAEVWQELLGIEEISVHDDFFDIGGHSLLATRLAARLREIFRIDISLTEFFDKPTIRRMMDYIIAQWGDAEIVEEIARTYREIQSLDN